MDFDELAQAADAERVAAAVDVNVQGVSDELIDPLTGEVIDPSNIDAMAEAFEQNKDTLDRLRNFDRNLRKRLAAMTTGTAKTRRLRGNHYRLKVEIPNDTWDGTMLKEAWNSYPALAPKYLRIGKIDPQLREVKKLAAESGDAAFEQFKQMVLRANQGHEFLTPTVKVESKE